MIEPADDRLEGRKFRRALRLLRALRREIGEGSEEALRAVSAIEVLLAEKRRQGPLDRTSVEQLSARLRWLRSIFPPDGD